MVESGAVQPMDPSSISERKKVVKEHRQNVLSGTKGEQQLATVRRRFRSKKKYFHCPLLLKNTLPDPIPGPKLMSMPLDLQSFVDFKSTALDTEYKWKHHCERTMGVHVELIDLEAQTPSREGFRAPLHPDDERLLKWEQLGANANGGAPRKERAFFRKTVFQSNDLSRNLGGMKKSNRPLLEQPEIIDAETVLSKAKKSFDVFGEYDNASSSSLSAAPLKHKTKPHLTMEWAIPVYPDENLWANQYRYVAFDDDPSGGSSLKKRKINDALIVNAKNEYNARAQKDILTGSLIVPKGSQESGDATSSSLSNLKPYEWQKQYSMQLEKVRTADESKGHFLLFIDEKEKSVTFKDMYPQKLELRGGISATHKRLEENDTYAVCRRDFTTEETKKRNSLVNQLNGIEEEEQEEEYEGEDDMKSDSDGGLSDA